VWLSISATAAMKDEEAGCRRRFERATLRRPAQDPREDPGSPLGEDRGNQTNGLHGPGDTPKLRETLTNSRPDGRASPKEHCRRLRRRHGPRVGLLRRQAPIVGEEGCTHRDGTGYCELPIQDASVLQPVLDRPLDTEPREPVEQVV
jgi:hypothetical protein